MFLYCNELNMVLGFHPNYSSGLIGKKIENINCETDEINNEYNETKFCSWETETETNDDNAFYLYCFFENEIYYLQKYVCYESGLDTIMTKDKTLNLDL